MQFETRCAQGMIRRTIVHAMIEKTLVVHECGVRQRAMLLCYRV